MRDILPESIRRELDARKSQIEKTSVASDLNLSIEERIKIRRETVKKLSQLNIEKEKNDVDNSGVKKEEIIHDEVTEELARVVREMLEEDERKKAEEQQTSNEEEKIPSAQSSEQENDVEVINPEDVEIIDPVKKENSGNEEKKREVIDLNENEYKVEEAEKKEEETKKEKPQIDVKTFKKMSDKMLKDVISKSKSGIKRLEKDLEKETDEDKKQEIKDHIEKYEAILEVAESVTLEREDKNKGEER